MVVNFKARGISRDAHKLTRTTTLIYKKKWRCVEECSNGEVFFTWKYIKIIFFYINTSKLQKNIKNLNLNKKINFK